MGGVQLDHHDVVKMDVEGFELTVLAGAGAILTVSSQFGSQTRHVCQWVETRRTIVPASDERSRRKYLFQPLRGSQSCRRAGDMFEQVFTYLSCEINWTSMQEKNSGTKQEIADSYVGKLLRAGFEVRAGRLLGPPRKGRSDAKSIMRELMKEPLSD